MKLMQVAVAFDQLVNAILGGYADETMSARCWRLRAAQPYTFLQRAIDKLLWFDKDHCQTSYESELKRKYSPREEGAAPYAKP